MKFGLVVQKIAKAFQNLAKNYINPLKIAQELKNLS